MSQLTVAPITSTAAGIQYHTNPFSGLDLLQAGKSMRRCTFTIQDWSNWARSALQTVDLIHSKMADHEASVQGSDNAMTFNVVASNLSNQWQRLKDLNASIDADLAGTVTGACPLTKEGEQSRNGVEDFDTLYSYASQAWYSLQQYQSELQNGTV